MKLVYFLFGKARIKVSEQSAVEALNVCMKESIPYSSLSVGRCAFVTFDVKLIDLKRFEKAMRDSGIEFEITVRAGLPIIFSRFKYRFGLMTGLLLLTAVIVYFGSIIWDIRVVGNESLTTAEVYGMLEKYGISVGKRYSDIDVNKIQNQIQIESDDIGFIAINISGNIVNVEIRENKKGEDKSSGLGFANVVAKKSGIIEEVRGFVGDVTVKAGQVVNEGDLLISGIYDSKTVGVRYTRAAGEIMARTVEEYRIEIPLKYEKKQYTGVVNCEKSLNFYGETFNIFKKYRKDIYLYDTIYTVDNYGISGLDEIPVGITTVSYHEYVIIEAERTPEEAQALAYAELEKRIAESESEFLVKKTVTPSLSEDSFSIYCIVEYIENIAMTSEFYVDLQN